jgi:hypothetical protein
MDPHQQPEPDPLATLQCDMCPKRYRLLHSLREHVKYSHGPRSGTFSCYVCNAKSKNARSLRSHFYSYHKDELPELKRRLKIEFLL